MTLLHAIASPPSPQHSRLNTIFASTDTHNVMAATVLAITLYAAPTHSAVAASAKILPHFPPYFPPVIFCAFRCTSYALGTTSIYRCIVLPREIIFSPESSRNLEGSHCNSGAYYFAIYLVQNTWPILNCLPFHYIASSHSWTK